MSDLFYNTGTLSQQKLVKSFQSQKVQKNYFTGQNFYIGNYTSFWKQYYVAGFVMSDIDLASPYFN